MCIFSGNIISVGDTCIFARHEGDEQILVYSMTLGAGEDLAMILPLPVRRGSGEQALSFVNLNGYPSFFRDMVRGWPPKKLPKGARTASKKAASKALTVHTVGAYEASYVSRRVDFRRLDPRFRLDTSIWRELPQYRGWGYVVFQLREGKQRVHPLAFRFPTRYPNRLFFPTLHVHDGQVKKTAAFDHRLFLQLSSDEEEIPPSFVERYEPGRSYGSKPWVPSAGLAKRFLKAEKCKGLILPEQKCYRRELRWVRRANEDVFVELAG